MNDGAIPVETPVELDALTGLPNRLGIESFLRERESLGKQDLTLLSVQISRFGSINASMGGTVADKVIALTARRLVKTFPQALKIARTHGDHFCLLFEGLDSAEETIERLDDFTRRPFAVSGEVVVLGVRIGVARVEPSLPTAALLLNASEIALESAKARKIHVCYFQPERREQARQVHALENDLRVALISHHAELHRALANDEFQIHYQPIIDCKTGRIHAFEALMRWFHPEKGYLPPELFIPMAEQIQVMDVLGSWVIQKAVADAASWPASADGSRIGVSINISPSQFIEPSLMLHAVSQAMLQSGLEPSLVKLEVTESGALDGSMTQTLLRLRRMGCKIALDDFGTGYSSLTHLNQLPLDYLKLDRSFIKDLDSDSLELAGRSRKLTQAILSLAESFGLTSVVEGVETWRQLNDVLGMGAGLIQGYFFSRPMPVDALPDYIANFSFPGQT